MHVRYIDISNFRTLKNQKVEFSRRVTLLVGRNGQGKTSVLEAIYLLSQAKSFRKAKPRDYVNWGGASCAHVYGYISASDGARKIAYEINEGKRRILINDSVISEARRFYGQFIAIDFTPSDLDIVLGAPSNRRSFVDRLLVMLDRTFVNVLMQYQKVLKQRNALMLSIVKKSSAHKHCDIKRDLSMWSAPLVELGSEISQRRKDVLGLLEHHATKYYRYLVNIDCKHSNAENIKLNYISKFYKENIILSKTELTQRYQESIERDLKQKTTTFGVHNDDIHILLDTGYGDKDARSFASQGQSKSIALALKLASIDVVRERVNEIPVLLLDDVESELDPQRRDALYKLIAEFDNQVIITSTELSNSAKTHFEEVDVRLIEDGYVSVQKIN